MPHHKIFLHQQRIQIYLRFGSFCVLLLAAIAWLLTDSYERFGNQSDVFLAAWEQQAFWFSVGGLGLFSLGFLATRHTLKINEQSDALAWRSQAIDAIGEAIVITSPAGIIEYVNPAFTEISGYSQSEAVGKTPSVLNSGIQIRAFYAHLWATILSGATWQGELVNRRKNGTYFHDSVTISPVKNQDGVIQHFIAVHHDISKQKILEQELSQLAHFDRLTCLPNRALFLDRLDRAMSESRRDHSRFSVFFVDLDGFKSINDQYGHAVGDMVLEITAKRLMTCIRESDTVARFGGDEFAFLLRSVSQPDAIATVGQKIIQAVAQPILSNDITYHVGASIGIAVFPDDGVDTESLLRNADTAMYAAKKQGKGCWVSACELI